MPGVPSAYSWVRKGLISLANVSEAEWRRREDLPDQLRPRQLTGELLGKKLPVDAETISLPLKDVPFLVLLLPPTDVSVLCVLAVSWDFRDAEPGKHVTRSFKMFLFPEGGFETTVPTVIRFDDAEPGSTWGFSHAQVCDTLTPHDDLFPGISDDLWLSAEIPRIPVASTGPTSMLVCLLAGLYGADSSLMDKVLNTMRDEESWTAAERLGWRR